LIIFAMDLAKSREIETSRGDSTVAAE